MADWLGYLPQAMISEIKPKEIFVIDCKDGELLFDERVLIVVRSEYLPHTELDESYIELLPVIAGRSPSEPYFHDAKGGLRRIGWFVGFTDEQTVLDAPFEKALHSESDVRVDWRSMPSVIDTPFNVFFGGGRIVPFAALYTNGCPPGALQNYVTETPGTDSLCFDTSERPHKVVVCDGALAAEAVWDIEYRKKEDIDYDSFLTPVSTSFSEFIKLLTVASGSA